MDFFVNIKVKQKCCYPQNKESISVKKEEFYFSNNTNIDSKTAFQEGTSYFLKKDGKKNNSQSIKNQSKSKNNIDDNFSEIEQNESPNFCKNIEKNYNTTDKIHSNDRNNANVNPNQRVSGNHNYNLTFNEQIIASPINSNSKSNNQSNNHHFNNQSSSQTNNNLNNSKHDLVLLILIKNDESSIVDFANRVISEEDVKKASKLLIEEIEGDIFQNNKLSINAMGLVNGQRKAKDGIIFFGPKLKKVIIK